MNNLESHYSFSEYAISSVCSKLSVMLQTKCNTNHVRQLMGNNGGSGLFVSVRGAQWIIQQVGLSVGHQTPVFHCTKVEVWQSDLV